MNKIALNIQPQNTVTRILETAEVCMYASSRSHEELGQKLFNISEPQFLSMKTEGNSCTNLPRAVAMIE